MEPPLSFRAGSSWSKRRDLKDLRRQCETMCGTIAGPSLSFRKAIRGDLSKEPFVESQRVVLALSSLSFRFAIMEFSWSHC